RTHILEFVDEQVRDLRDAGLEPRTILVGPEAYEELRVAVEARFNKVTSTLEQYQWLTVVVDPFRGAETCVLPAPGEVAAGVRAERRHTSSPTP
ncbi:MAG: family 4C encapsulin nanocompartment shell protein, partial [Bacteroidota bacterium]